MSLYQFQTASASSSQRGGLTGEGEAVPSLALAGINPHADQLGTGPKERGIEPVQVAGGRCDCKTLSHTPNNPAGIQFYFPWPIVVCRANPCGRREDEGTYSLRPIAAAAAAFPKIIPNFRGVGSLIPGLRRALQATKQSRSGFANRLQVSILSAGSAGLVGCFDRHEATKEKFPHDGKTGTRPGNLTARKRNAY